MRIFTEDSFDGRVNFVDENNVVLGFETGQQCCEDWGWFIADKPITDHSFYRAGNYDGPNNLPGFVFDTKSIPETVEDDELNYVIFRIANGKEEKFIHLYNIHNGYYAHGFEFSSDGKSITGDL